MNRIKKLLDNLHFPLWILKDMAWLFGYGWTSLILAIPTITISIILILYTIGNERKQNLVILFWLLANTLWMSHELFDTTTKEIAIFSFLMGIVVAITYIPKLIKDSID
jgi:hypothetical protein